jgi:predicted phosphodiesterase
MMRRQPGRRTSTAPPSRLKTDKLGLIGDVHTEHALLRQAIDHLRENGCEILACTGDIPDGAGSAKDVDQCCKLLQEAQVLTVSGNHDRWLLDDEMRSLAGATPREEVAASTFDYLLALPTTVELSTPLGLALLCHGLGDDDMAQVHSHERGHELESNEALQALVRSAKYRIVLNGHAHRAGVIDIAPLLIVNGGTLRRDRKPCCSIVDFGRGEITYYDLTPGGPTALRTTLPLTPLQ